MAVCWRKDSITKRFVKDNEAMLNFPGNMNAKELANACTYCETIYNPYAEELMRRTELLEKFRKATDVKKQRRILDKACGCYGIRLY